MFAVAEELSVATQHGRGYLLHWDAASSERLDNLHQSALAPGFDKPASDENHYVTLASEILKYYK